MMRRNPMLKRILALAGLFVFLFAVNLVLAGGNVHQVTIVKAGDGKLTCIDMSGNQHTISVAKNAKITLDGKTCKLDDLRKDYKAAVTGERVDDEKMITAIEARSK